MTGENPNQSRSLCCLKMHLLLGSELKRDNQLRYQSSWCFQKSTVEIKNDQVFWQHSTWRGKWNHKAPLSTLEPIPMFTTHPNFLHGAFWVFAFCTPPCVLMFMYLGATVWPITTSFLSFMAASSLLLCDQQFGPMRWAGFESTYKNRTVYFLQGSDARAFEMFVEALSTEIARNRSVSPQGEG